MADQESTAVAPGMPVLADHFARLRRDAIINHTHEKQAGGRLDHASLTQGAIANHTHTNIRTHLMGGGAAFVDLPGGSDGVHGLSYIGSVGGGVGYKTGDAFPVTYSQLYVLAGRYELRNPRDRGGPWTIHFGIDQANMAWSIPPYVVVTPVMVQQRDWFIPAVSIYSVTTTEMVVGCNGRSPYYFDWTAIGPAVEV